MAKDWKQDGGHGGIDPGAIAKGNTEKVYTLEAALYVDKRLADHGIKSDVTRSSDTTLDENDRVAKVCQSKKCISHHFNAGGGSGAEVIHSIYSDGKFAHMIIDEFKKAGYPVRPRPVYFRKGSNGDYYYMHRRTGACETNIVEYDFVDGPQAEKIKDKSYREGMYECVVRAICRKEGVNYKPRTVVSVSTPTNVIRYIYTGGHAYANLQSVHAYLFKAGHGFDVKRGNDGSVIFLVGPYDTGAKNFKDSMAELGKFDKHIKLLTREQAAEWRK